MPQGKWLVAMSAVVILCVGCNPVYTDTDFDPDAEFASYHTYSWLKIKEKDPTNAAESKQQSPLVGNRIRQDIDKELAAKGMQRMDEGGNLLVVYYQGAQQMTEVTKNMYSAGDVWATARVAGSGATIREVNQSTLIIDLIDSSTMELVWRSTADNTQRSDVSQEKIYETIDKAIKQMFKKYPPK